MGLTGTDQAMAPKPAPKRRATDQPSLFAPAAEEMNTFESPAPRERSAAFPLDLPWRLVHMYSLYGDVVLDPFAGTGTTALAAACAGRSSVCVEREPALAELIRSRVREAPRLGRARERLAAHRRFVEERLAAGKALGHQNGPHGVPVITSQETELTLYEAVDARIVDGVVEVGHARVG